MLLIQCWLQPGFFPNAGKFAAFVSLIRPRDGLIPTMNNQSSGGSWVDTPGVEWMWLENNSIVLPCGTAIPSNAGVFDAVRRQC